MRGAFVLLLLLTAAALGYWFVQTGGGEPAPRGESVSAVGPAEVPRDAAPAVPTRTRVQSPNPEGLADEPTACLLVVDHEGGRPIADAAVRRVKDRAEIGFTDDRGMVELALAEREQLAVIADRYLMRMSPTRLGSGPEAPQRVELVRDEWSVWHRFELRGPDAVIVDEAFVSIRADGDPGRPTHEDAIVARALREDALLQELLAPTRESLLVTNGQAVRFAQAVPYDLEFATTALVATLRLAASTRNRAIRVDLQRGHSVSGWVKSDGGQPVGGASITRQSGGPLGLLSTTQDNGRFSFAPLPPGEVTLLVRHPDHEPVAFGPVATGTTNAMVTLERLPASVLRGRVRLRPGLDPVAGAVVSWAATADPPVTAVTAADGTFELRTTGEIAGRLLVSAPGCVALEELVAPGAAFADYDLLPSSTAERLAARMTAVLAGTVADAAGRPLGGARVRWVPRQRGAGSGVMPMRRTVSGHVLRLPLSTITAEDGSFELETHHFGAGELRLDSGERGIHTAAVAGERKDGHRLQQQ